MCCCVFVWVFTHQAVLSVWLPSPTPSVFFGCRSGIRLSPHGEDSGFMSVFMEKTETGCSHSVSNVGPSPCTPCLFVNLRVRTLCIYTRADSEDESESVFLVFVNLFWQQVVVHFVFGILFVYKSTVWLLVSCCEVCLRGWFCTSPFLFSLFCVLVTSRKYRGVTGGIRAWS